LPLSGFKQALLTEINVAPAQLHPNSWAFVRKGLRDLVQPFWAPSFRGRLPPLLRGQESREEAMGNLQWGGGESPPDPISAIL